MRDQVTMDHPRTVLNRLDTGEGIQSEHERRIRQLEEWLDLLYRRVGIPYPGNEPAEAGPPRGTE